MTIVGLIQAFNEADNIAAAIASLQDAGCGRVVVVDGAWTNPDGTYFGGQGFLSDDGMRDLAIDAGAELLTPAEQPLNDGTKRDWAIRNCTTGQFDNVLLMDADERLIGRLDDPPSGHACVVLRNDKPNDLPFRTPWLDAATRTSVPMLRWFRWSPTLCCKGPGRYEDKRKPIEPYMINVLAAARLDNLGRAALAALRSVELDLPNEHISILPIVNGIEISHCVEPTDERVAAKRAYYEPLLAAAT